MAKRACNRLIERRTELRRVSPDEGNESSLSATAPKSPVLPRARAAQAPGNAERGGRSAMRVKEKRQLSFYTPTRLPRYK